jgi:hypothetical protein
MAISKPRMAPSDDTPLSRSLAQYIRANRIAQQEAATRQFNAGWRERQQLMRHSRPPRRRQRGRG